MARIKLLKCASSTLLSSLSLNGVTSLTMSVNLLVSAL